MPTLLAPTARFQPRRRVLARKVADEGVLLDLETHRYFRLSPTGWRIWELLAEGLEVAAILATLEEEFAAQAGELERDLASLLGELESAALVERQS